jgi:hypothetical protein
LETGLGGSRALHVIGSRWSKSGKVRLMPGKLHLAQAQSNGVRRGRKRDLVDAERLLKRHSAYESVLNFVPDPEERLFLNL